MAFTKPLVYGLPFFFADGKKALITVPLSIIHSHAHTKAKRLKEESENKATKSSVVSILNLKRLLLIGFVLHVRVSYSQVKPLQITNFICCELCSWQQQEERKGNFRKVSVEISRYLVVVMVWEVWPTQLFYNSRGFENYIEKVSWSILGGFGASFSHIMGLFYALKDNILCGIATDVFRKAKVALSESTICCALCLFTFSDQLTNCKIKMFCFIYSFAKSNPFL